MALIPCFECGKEISDKAVTCPQCGTPIPIEKEKGFAPFLGRLLGSLPTNCRKCRSPINHNANFCKTCGAYCPVHEKNTLVFSFLFISFLIAFYRFVFL